MVFKNLTTITGLLLLAFSAFQVVADTGSDSNTIYGDFRYSLNSIDVGNSTLSGNNNASRLGFKGDIGVSGSVQAFYNLQVGVNVDGAGDAFSQRFYLAGLKGSFGKLTYGRTSTAYKMAGLRADPFYDTSAGLGLGGANFGLSPVTNGWTDNSFSYTSPAFGNFALNASIFLDDGEGNNHDTNLGVLFKKDAHTFGVQYLAIDGAGVVAKSTADSDAFRVHAASKFGKWSLAASAEFIDMPLTDQNKYQYFSAAYQHRENLKFAASFGHVDGVSANADGSGFTLGSFFSLPSKTIFSLIYSDVNLDDGQDRRVIALGVSQKINYTVH